MRAVAEDGEAAALMGIDVNKVVKVFFMLGGAMAGIAGVFYAFVYKQVYFYMLGFTPGIKAFGAPRCWAACANIPGAVVSSSRNGQIRRADVVPRRPWDPAPYQLRDLIAFTLLIMVLIFRPQGLLVKKMAKKRA